MNSSLLTVYKSPYSKIRLGKDNDGGYICAVLPDVDYTLLLSGGIGDDISFEEDFLIKYPNAKCFAFDKSIEKLPKENNRIKLFSKNIGYENNDEINNLHQYLNENNEYIFVKMDIEGGEIPWIKSLAENHLNKIEQMIIEFHSPFNDEKIFEIINKYFYLIHFHGNSFCGLVNNEGINMPNVFECTYLNKRYFSEEPELNTDVIPSPLDMTNILGYEEIQLNYPPFVHFNK